MEHSECEASETEGPGAEGLALHPQASLARWSCMHLAGAPWRVLEFYDFSECALNRSAINALTDLRLPMQWCCMSCVLSEAHWHDLAGGGDFRACRPAFMARCSRGTGGGGAPFYSWWTALSWPGCAWEDPRPSPADSAGDRAGGCTLGRPPLKTLS